MTSSLSAFFGRRSMHGEDDRQREFSMRASLEKLATWLVRIMLLPLAVFFGWYAVRDLLVLFGSPPELQATNFLGPAAESVVVALLIKAIFSSSPPWRNESLKTFFVWILSIAALILNFFFASAAVSYLWGHSFSLHGPTSALEEFVSFASGIALMILEIMLVDKISKRKNRAAISDRSNKN